MDANKGFEAPNWGHDWAGSLSQWETRTPDEMPIWQYTAAALNPAEDHHQHHNNSQIMYHSPPEHDPVSPYEPYFNPPSASSSAIPSPNVDMFPRNARFSNGAPIPRPLQPARKRPRMMEVEVEEEEEEDSDDYPWEEAPQRRKGKKASGRPAHRRTHSASEVSVDAKRAHTVVEKNYRERLNDKIADLALYLFETSSDSRSKPSKSLVMTRAKERLKQLESRNRSLEGEVVKLRQHIAILDHIVASKGSEPPVSPL